MAKAVPEAQKASYRRMSPARMQEIKDQLAMLRRKPWDSAMNLPQAVKDCMEHVLAQEDELAAAGAQVADLQNEAGRLSEENGRLATQVKDLGAQVERLKGELDRRSGK